MDVLVRIWELELVGVWSLQSSATEKADPPSLEYHGLHGPWLNNTQKRRGILARQVWPQVDLRRQPGHHGTTCYLPTFLEDLAKWVFVLLVGALGLRAADSSAWLGNLEVPIL